MRSYPVTVFDRPQWKLLPDPKGPRVYGNVSNELEIARRGRTHKVALAVPAELFTVMREVLRVDTASSVTLSLDLLDGWFVFSALESGAAEDTLHDLWAIPESSLPGWMLDSAFFV